MDGFRLAAMACACLLLAACGGTTKQASIRRPVAMRLASQSDAVAAALQRGNGCLARSRARTLRSQVAAAIAAGSIPASLAPDARGASARLVSRISCTPPPPPPAAALTCAGSDGRKRAPAQPGKPERGKSGQGRENEIEQDEDARDRQRKGCE